MASTRKTKSTKPTKRPATSEQAPFTGAVRVGPVALVLSTSGNLWLKHERGEGAQLSNAEARELGGILDKFFWRVF